MGDRANVYVIDRTVEGPDPCGLYLYTHWNGSEWPEFARQALIFGRERWDDPSYLTRILISQMYHEIVGETAGGGVSHELGDNDHYPLLVLDIPHKTVSYCPIGMSWENLPPLRETWYGTCSFEAFTSMAPARWVAEHETIAAAQKEAVKP